MCGGCSICTCQGFPSMEIGKQRCRRSPSQFAIDFSFTLMQHIWIMSSQDQNIKLIWMSEIDFCPLRQVLTPADQFVHVYIQVSYCKHTLSSALERLASTASCIFNMQHFDFEAAMTEGYSWLMFKALHHEESTKCLSIHLPCLSLTFSRPRACIDSLFPLPTPSSNTSNLHFLSLTHTYCTPLWASSSRAKEGVHSWSVSVFVSLCVGVCLCCGEVTLLCGLFRIPDR